MKKNFPFLLFIFFLATSVFAQNNSINFDGTDDYIQSTFPGILGSNARTVEAWVKTTWNGTQRVIVDWGAISPNGSRYTVNMINGGLRIEVGGNGVTTATLINDGNWHHIATTYDNSLATNKHKLYIDGVFIIGSNLTVTVNTLSTNALMIGRRVDAVNYWQGNIDEVRVWNTARTAAEIAANMSTELTGGEAGLVYYAKFDEVGASCDIVDCSAGQHHGTRLGTGGANNLPQFSTDVPTITDVACTTPLVGCTLAAMCSVDGISVSNISACNNQGTSDPADDTFTANVTVTFTDAPATGNLVLSGDGTAAIAVGSLGMGTYTFTGVSMSADGTPISLTATFSAEPACTLTNANAGTAPASCSVILPPPTCSVSGISVSNISACNSNGTPANAADDTFTANVTVTFSNPPANGTLNLSGDATAAIAVGSLGAGTYTFTAVTMVADGTPISLNAAFSDAPTCSLSNPNAGTAPANCSPNAPTIPTMSEWGLILFALIVFTMMVVFGTQQQTAFAMSSTKGQVSSGARRGGLPFNKTLYFKVLPLVYLGFALVFAIATKVFGYEITNADIPGSLLSGAVIAYLFQFVLVTSNSKKNN
ncbi:MAG: IPTL-CTERM sorting domain-containing protein [Saprospiraceae bacterium]